MKTQGPIHHQDQDEGDKDPEVKTFEGQKPEMEKSKSMIETDTGILFFLIFRKNYYYNLTEEKETQDPVPDQDEEEDPGIRKLEGKKFCYFCSLVFF